MSKKALVFGMLILMSISASGQGIVCSKDSSSSILYTIKDGECWSYSCKDGKAVYKSAEEKKKCIKVKKCTQGKTRVYTNNGKKCEQTCCDNKLWSRCNQSCDKIACREDECYDGNRCQGKPAEYQEVKGKCKYIYNCDKLSCGKNGWECGGKKLKQVINGNGYKQHGEWSRKDKRKDSGIKCSEVIKVVNEKTASEDCIKHTAKLQGKTVVEIKKSKQIFTGQCYIKDANGEYSYLKCWNEQDKCK